jgi:uncharacterized protein YbjT (DUF2867 family)
MILVTGATGNAGSQVVRELIERGAEVRAFVRDADKARARLGEEVELATGDFADSHSVRAALDGVADLVLSCSDDPRRVEWEAGAIDAAAAAGVERILKLSTVGAAPGAPVAFWDWHGRVERHLQASGVPAVVLQSSFYMSNLLAAGDQVANTGQLVAPAGGARIAMIDPRDVGAAAAAVLTRDGGWGRTHLLTGPEAITYRDVAEEISQATGRQVEFIDVPDEAARQAMVGAGMPEFVADQLVRIFGQLRQGAAEETTDTFEALTGRRPGGFAAFARDHAALFAPANRAVHSPR